MFQWRSPSRHDVDVINRGVENADFQRLPEERYRGTGTERRYGGFYTQADMRALIAYAAARQITIVPEIDMPGHVMAAIASYPELSCTGQAAWGETFSVPLCPGKAEVYTFVENVWTKWRRCFLARTSISAATRMRRRRGRNTPAVRRSCKWSGKARRCQEQ